MKYKEYQIRRRGKFIHINGLKIEITDGDMLYEADRAGIKAKGGARGLYKFMKELSKHEESFFHDRTIDSIVNRLVKIGKANCES